jgi:hypothetical protein
LTVQNGSGGMGMSKHRKSGRAPRSPRFKHGKQIEANRQAEQDAIRASRRKPAMFGSVSEAMKGNRS